MSIRIEVPFKLQSSDLETLVLLYQPLFSFPALSFYITLYGIAQQETLVSKRDLIRRLHCKEETLTLWQIELEQLGLLRSFENPNLEFVLVKPLSPHEFLSHQLLSRLFASVNSQEVFSLMKERYRETYRIDPSKETTKSFDMRRLVSWNAVDEESFAKEERSRIHAAKFDAVEFFKGFSLFPAKLVSEDVLSLVAEYGSFYQMSFVDMKSVLLETIKFDKSVFDKYRFEKLMLEKYGKTSTENVDDPFKLDPMSFLVYRQGHDYVSAAERNAIMSIKKDYGYGNDIANVVIDFILNGKNKQINKGYIDFLVQPLKRKGVETAEQAKIELNLTQQQFTKKPNHEVKMPAYTKPVEVVEDQAELDAMRREFEALLKKGEN